MMLQEHAISMALFVMILATLSCSGADTDVHTEEAVTLILFEEQEAGTGVYPVRMLVSDQYLRIDDGVDEGSFLLYDRSSQLAYSVDHEEGQILIIDDLGGKVGQPDYSIDVVVNDSDDIPAIAGIRPASLTISAGGESCFSAVVVSGLMKHAAAALTDYRLMLSRRQQATLNTMPIDLITPCFLTRYVYGLALPLESGFPVREWDGNGYLRELVNFDEHFPEPAGIFSLPEGYAELRLTL